MVLAHHILVHHVHKWEIRNVCFVDVSPGKDKMELELLKNLFTGLSFFYVKAQEVVCEERDIEPLNNKTPMQ